TLTYGLEGTHAQAALGSYSDSQAIQSPPASDNPPVLQIQQHPTTFDELVENMLTSPGSTLRDELKQDEVGSLMSFDNLLQGGSTQEFDQSLFDSWLELLHAFPDPEGTVGDQDYIPSVQDTPFAYDTHTAPYADSHAIEQASAVSTTLFSPSDVNASLP